MNEYIESKFPEAYMTAKKVCDMLGKSIGKEPDMKSRFGNAYRTNLQRNAEEERTVSAAARYFIRNNTAQWPRGFRFAAVGHSAQLFAVGGINDFNNALSMHRAAGAGATRAGSRLNSVIRNWNAADYLYFTYC